MNKPDFVRKVKETLQLNSLKVADEMVDKFTDLVFDLATSGEEITLGKLGKFVIVERAERKCRNLQTGEEMVVPAKKVVKFKESGVLKRSDIK